MAKHENQGFSKHVEFPQTDTTHMHALMECMSICAACARKCIDEGHKTTASLCAQCADVCSLAIKSVSCQSEFNTRIMELCTEVCKRCAEECQKMDVAHCQECAEACKKCANACSHSHSMA